jgi:hypothetical protein
MKETNYHPLVFLVHATEDKEQVRILHKRLTKAGARPWLDEIDLLPGQDWQLEIASVLAGADFVIACLSQNSVAKSGFVQRELREALTMQGRKPAGAVYLIPVLLDGCEVPDLRIPELGIHMRNIQWLDLRTEDAYPRLLRSIGCEATAGKSAAPMVEMRYTRAAEWPYTKPCPKCGGTMQLNHDSEEYGCGSCDHWEYGP